MKLFSIANSLRLFSLVAVAFFAIFSPTESDAITFSNSSRLASGKWVKVKVTQTGIQQISHNQLRELGLDPSKTTVYGSGAASFVTSEFTDYTPDDLVPTYSEHTPDGRLLFYGEGPAHYDIAYSDGKYTFDRAISPYSTYSAYFLSDSAPAPVVEELPFTPSDDALDTHISVNYIENERVNSFAVGAFMWDTDFTSGSVKQDFKIKDFATAGVR